MSFQSNNLSIINGYQIYTDTILGKGATGNVYKGVRTSDRVSVAIKAIQMSNVNNEVTQYLLQGQKKALTTISDPFVVKCEEIIQHKDYCYIVMEQCKMGTLREYIKSKGFLTENEAIPMFRKIVHGYCSVIDAKIIHRDLKTANIMLRANKDPVIIDFGYCEMIMEKRPLVRYNVGSPAYMSPQAYQNSRYSEKSDVWALGIMLHEMLTGRTLDENKDIKQYFQDIVKDKIAPFNLPNCSELVQKLLQSALTIAPQQRATIHRLKYLIDISVGGPLMNPQGISEKPSIKKQPQTPSKVFNVRETIGLGSSSFHSFEESKRKFYQNQNRNSSSVNTGVYHTVQQYKQTKNPSSKVVLLNIPNENEILYRSKKINPSNEGKPIIFRNIINYGHINYVNSQGNNIVRIN